MMRDIDRIARRELARVRARDEAIRTGRGRPGMMGITHMCGFGGGGPENDPYWANVVALLHFDGADASTTFTDVKGHTFTRAGGEIDTAQSKFGGASGLFNATTDYIYCSHADFDFGTGDWTVECFAQWNVTSGDNGLFQIGSTLLPSTYAPMSVLATATNAVALWMNAGYTTSANGVIGTSGFYHIAAERYGSNVDLYVNGTSVVTRTAASMTGSQVLTIGGAYSTTFLHDGWIDELRVTKGVARYRGAFAVPGAAFPET